MTLLRRLRGRDLVVNVIDGVVWVSNSYWALAVPDFDHPMALLFGGSRVTLGPGRFRLAECLWRVGEAIDFSQRVQNQPELQPVDFRRIDNEPLFVRDNPDRWYVLMDLPGGHLGAYDIRYVDLLEELAPGSWFGMADPFAPIYRIHEDKPTAILMGVRHPVVV